MIPHYNNPGRAPMPFVRLEGDSVDHCAHGGHPLPAPEFISRRVQVLVTDHPATDRWITLTTTYGSSGSPVWLVEVVDGFSRPTQEPQTFPTLRRARNHANKLYNAMTEEDR